MDQKEYMELVETIAHAAWDSREYIRKHLRREEDEEIKKELSEKEVKNTDHYFIGRFQESVEQILKKTYNEKYNWDKEKKKSGTTIKDSVDIIGENKGRNCIIEIDATRHDQIAPKFVSRLALWGLEEPIDYVILLYDGTEKSGKPNSEKFVRYMYAILKAIKPDSSLIGIYVHTDKNYNKNMDYVEYWDCENQKFTINIKGYTSLEPCSDMNECARVAIKHYINIQESITFEKLCKKFTMSKRTGSSYISDKTGKSRAKPIETEIIGKDNKKHNIHVYSQFRDTGNQRNWDKFVKVCKKNKIVIEQSYIQDKYKQFHSLIA